MRFRWLLLGILALPSLARAQVAEPIVATCLNCDDQIPVYSLIQDEGTGLAQRTTLNFLGSPITCVDNAGKTECTVSASSAAHDLLSTTHTDTFPESPVLGSIIAGLAGAPVKWGEVPPGAAGTLLFVESSGIPGWKVIGDLTSATTPAPADELVIEVDSLGAHRAITLPDALKIVNLLTEDTAPDEAADFLVTYDASASGAKKVLPNSLAFVRKVNVQGPVSTTDTTETTIYTYQIDANTLGTASMYRVLITCEYLQNLQANDTLTLRVKYGATTIFDDTTSNVAQSVARRGATITVNLMGDGATNAQRLHGTFNVGPTTSPTAGRFGDLSASSAVAWRDFGGTAAIDSTANANLVVTIQVTTGNSTTNVYTMQKAITEYIP